MTCASMLLISVCCVMGFCSRDVEQFYVRLPKSWMVLSLVKETSTVFVFVCACMSTWRMHGLVTFFDECVDRPEKIVVGTLYRGGVSLVGSCRGLGKRVQVCQCHCSVLQGNGELLLNSGLKECALTCGSPC